MRQRVDVVQCDHCKKVKPVTQWRVTHGGVTKTLDLCLECSAPIKRILATATDGYSLYRPADASRIEEARRRRQEITG